MTDDRRLAVSGMSRVVRKDWERMERSARRAHEYSGTQRKQRAMQQRLLLLSFERSVTHFHAKVFGASRRVYDVQIGSSSSSSSEAQEASTTVDSTTCSCPDYQRRRRRCKHIYFLLRVLHVPCDLWDADPFYTSVSQHFIQQFRRGNSSWSANGGEGLDIDGEVQHCPPEEAEEHRESVQPKLSVAVAVFTPVAQRPADECVICYEDMDMDKERTKYCQVQCGNTFHASCIERFFDMSRQKRCPMCRISWQETRSKIE